MEAFTLKTPETIKEELDTASDAVADTQYDYRRLEEHKKIAQEQYVFDQINSGESNSVTQAMKKWRNLNDSSLFDSAERNKIKSLVKSGGASKKPRTTNSTVTSDFSKLSDDEIRKQLGL